MFAQENPRMVRIRTLRLTNILHAMPIFGNHFDTNNDKVSQDSLVTQLAEEVTRFENILCTLFSQNN